MANSIPQLFSGQTTNGNSSSLHWEGGSGVLVASGFSAATITLQYSPDGETTWVSTTVTLTADGAASFDLPPGEIRLNQASTSGDDIDAWVGKVHPLTV